MNLQTFSKGLSITLISVINYFSIFPAFGQQTSCSNYWTNPNTGQIECFGVTSNGTFGVIDDNSKSYTLSEENKPYTPSEENFETHLLKFADKLETCKPYKGSFDHPFTGEKLTREIMGMASSKCVYIEGMPVGGKMECKYSKDSLSSIAQYYRDSVNADSFGVNISGSITDSTPETTYKINGQIVDNPLQESMNNGDCVISGS